MADERWQAFRSQFTTVESNISRVIQGKPEQVRLALVLLVAEGHLLIEDVPGVGKTMLAKALAKSISCSFRRIQFTPDLLPIDITGVSVFNQEHADFEFRPGAVFANIVLGDEINRGSPKTQSALLECMEEHQVTVDGVTHLLGTPFMVLATQNPIEHEGTYPLPEAQLDRFMMRLRIGYPDEEAEMGILSSHGKASTLPDTGPVSDAAAIAGMIATAREVFVAPSILRYIVGISEATRIDPDLYVGASPRASIMMLRASRALAASEGRDFVMPDDVKRLASSVLLHRLIPTADAVMAGRSLEAILTRVFEEVPVPVSEST